MAGAKFSLDFGKGVTLNRSPGNCHIPKAARAAGQPQGGILGSLGRARSCTHDPSASLPAQHIPRFSDGDIPLFCSGTTSFLLFHPLEVQDWSQCWTNPTSHPHPHIPCETSQKLFTCVNQTQILDSFPQNPGARCAVAAADPLCLPQVVFLLLFYGKKKKRIILVAISMETITIKYWLPRIDWEALKDRGCLHGNTDILSFLFLKKRILTAFL